MRNRKGRIFDNYYEKNVVRTELNNNVYTKIAEPKFQDDLGNFYGSNQNYLRIRSSYFLKTDILFT